MHWGQAKRLNIYMFSQSKIIMYIVIFTILSSVIGGCVWYFKWSQAEIQVLRDNNLKLTISVKQNEETIKVLTKDAMLVGESVLQVSTQFESARKENNVLRQKLAEHDIGFLAASKPRLIKKVVNKGTADVGRCMEILSGSPLTEKEKNATKKSQTNSSCSDLANPKYEARP